MSGPPPWVAGYDGRATEADILACFRLLLGRNPNPEEWPGHSARAGEALPAVVSSYLDSLEFVRRRLGRGSMAAAPETAELEGFRILASREDLAVGKTVLAGRYEPEVEAVFRAVLRPGMGVIDVGANIGFFTMLAGALVGAEGSVLALEPNPVNARMAEASRRLNGFAHVTVVQAAAGRGPGMLAINTSFSNGTTSAIEADAVLGVESVACVAVDQLALPGPRVGLIKLDVEGAEYNALLGCRGVIRRDRPVIVFEFGPSQLPGISGVTGEVLLQWLLGEGYGLAVIELGGPPTAVGRDWEAVMRAYEARGNDHIDVVATPLAPAGRGFLGTLVRRFSGAVERRFSVAVERQPC